MLQKISYQDQVVDEEQSSFLTPAYLYDVAKRRVLWFILTFAVVLAAGSVITLLLPAVYLSEGKILVESQQIPSDLVRPTVNVLANERVQMMEQRIMTRDRLLSIAHKHQLYVGNMKGASGTEMLDFMRTRTQIRPLEVRLPVRSGSTNRQIIAFTVGFEHEQPHIAQRVANELVTIILEEDVRTRTGFAAETTRFLERETRRLEGELNSLETQIAELKSRQARPPSDVGQTQLLALRSELLLKSSTYSDSHPDMKAIKQKIANLEKMVTPPKTDTGVGLDALERSREVVEKNLESTAQKLRAARLGESLERGQQSEKLEVIERPILPQKPIKPKREKIFALVLGFAAASGAGLVVMMEMFSSTIRRSSDVFGVIDRRSVLTIPYIATLAETRRNRNRKRIKITPMILLLIAIVGAAAAAYHWWYDLAPLLDKIRLRMPAMPL